MTENTLFVFYKENRVGKLFLDSDQQLCFDYDKNWLESSGAFAISHSMPLAKVVYVDAAQTFFSNLLPEAKIRKLLAIRLGVSEENDFSFLEAIGEDCAGALSISRKPLDKKKVSYKKISLNKIFKIYESQPIFYFGFKNEEVRLSLAGAQDKIAIYYDEKNFFLPQKGGVSTHILKFPSRDYAHLTENEYYVNQIARDCKLNVISTQLVQYKDFACLLSSRYDRSHISLDTQRLHQEDFCQIFGVSYKNKYENEGGPSFDRIFNFINEHSVNVIEDLEQLLKWLFFNICVGNCDNHAKNLSFLMKEPGKWSLSPFYDLLCTQIYPSISKKQAMSIGGNFDGSNLTAKHWQLLLENVHYSSARFVNDIALPIVDTIHLSAEENLEFFSKTPHYDFMKQLKQKILTHTKRAEKSVSQLKS